MYKIIKKQIEIIINFKTQKTMSVGSDMINMWSSVAAFEVQRFWIDL